MDNNTKNIIFEVFCGDIILSNIIFIADNNCDLYFIYFLVNNGFIIQNFVSYSTLISFIIVISKIFLNIYSKSTKLFKSINS